MRQGEEGGPDWVAGIWNNTELSLTHLPVHLSIHPPTQTFVQSSANISVIVSAYYMRGALEGCGPRVPTLLPSSPRWKASRLLPWGFCDAPCERPLHPQEPTRQSPMTN